jgi:hypothetical protein
MIFVLDEANVLYVESSEAELQGAFEGVDVEDGAYRFFDESGNPLIAKFTVHNQRSKILGPVQWVRSGSYRLLPSDNVTAPHLSEVLKTAIAVEPNRYFSDLEAVRRTLTR